MSTLQEFISRIGEEFPADRLTYQKAIATFHPENADEAARLIRLANTCRAKLFITGFGNNIDPVGEPFTGMVTIRTDRLNRLITAAPDDLYVEVGAGYPMRELNRVLAADHLFLPLADLAYVGSVGGAVATNLTATLHGHDLAMKKYVVKAEVVTPEGDIITPGSVCFKSVSGYDIVKIFAPSWGLLGLIVRVFLRVLPDSARHEYDSLTLQAQHRDRFLAGFDENNFESDALYSRKIKAKFDPNTILPIV